MQYLIISNLWPSVSTCSIWTFRKQSFFNCSKQLKESSSFLTSVFMYPEESMLNASSSKSVSSFSEETVEEDGDEFESSWTSLGGGHG